jgi:hypothetical protein
MRDAFEIIEAILNQKDFEGVISEACKGLKEIADAETVGFYRYDSKSKNYKKEFDLKIDKMELPEFLDIENMPSTFDFLESLKNGNTVGMPYPLESSIDIFNGVVEFKDGNIKETKIEVPQTTFFRKLVFPFQDRQKQISTNCYRFIISPIKYESSIFGFIFLLTKNVYEIKNNSFQRIKSICRILENRIHELDNLKFIITNYSDDFLEIARAPKMPKDFLGYYRSILGFFRKIDQTLVLGEIWFDPLGKGLYTTYNKMVLRYIDKVEYIPNDKNQFKLDLSNYAIGKAIKDHAVQFWSKVKDIPNFHNVKIQNDFPDCQMLAIPMHKHLESSIGVIVLYFPANNPSINKYIDFFQFCADFIGHSIRNRLFREKITISDYIFHIILDYLLRDPIKILEESSDYFKSLCKGIVQILSIGGFSVFFKDKTNSSILNLYATSGVEDHSSKKENLRIDIKKKRGLLFSVIEENDVVIEDDLKTVPASSDYEYHFPKENSDFDICKILLGAPIRSEDSIVGIIRFVNRYRDIPGPQFFDFNDVDMAWLIGSFFWLIKQQLQNLKNAYVHKHVAIHDMKNTLQASLAAAYMLYKRIPKTDDENIQKRNDYLFDNLAGSIKLLTFLMQVPDVTELWEPIFKKTKFIGEILAPVVGLVRWLAENRGFKIEYDSFIQIYILWLDKLRMQQLVYNLLINSIKYYDKDCLRRYIKISYKGNDKDYHYIAFEDYGIGIDINEKDRIFDFGFRGRNAKELAFEGDGIGLSSARIIAKKHGGIIEVTNLKEPTIFTLKLPISLEEGPLDEKNIIR